MESRSLLYILQNLLYKIPLLLKVIDKWCVLLDLSSNINVLEMVYILEMIMKEVSIATKLHVMDWAKRLDLPGVRWFRCFRLQQLRAEPCGSEDKDHVKLVTTG